MNDWSWYGGQKWEPNRESSKIDSTYMYQREGGAMSKPAMMPEIGWPPGPCTGLEGGGNIEPSTSPTGVWCESSPESQIMGAQLHGPVLKGRVVECNMPTVLAQVAGSRLEETGMEQSAQKRQEQTRVRQLEGLLTLSMQQHQIKMRGLTQATQELKEQQKSMKGKSTQTVEQWGKPEEGKKGRDQIIK